nr:immunoglobulin heavy chain junction region [Macaca mulatta]MOV48172.1 immunoglobulin heavy chain junction region [Macaca mulatta]MOV48273.1 immunoglobulin heavy chain junction region [Macaca mulatta]MOV48697.1 immunoglobulin heavy chain junction region [Macaca mulatta]
CAREGITTVDFDHW